MRTTIKNKQLKKGRETMKKILASLLIAAMLFSFAACGKQDTAREDGKVPIKNALIYDNNGVKITAKGMAEQDNPAMDLELENSGDTDVLISFSECVVNGYMADYTLQSEQEDSPVSVLVAAGKSTKAQMVFEKSALRRCGIEKICDISLRAVLENPETFEEIDYAQAVCLAVDDDVEQVYDDKGSVAYEKDAVKIIIKGFDPADESKKSVLVYVENGSENALDISAQKVKVNQKKATALYAADVLPGMRTVNVMRFEEDFKDIKELELMFCINAFDYQSGEIREVLGKSKLQSVKF